MILKRMKKSASFRGYDTFLIPIWKLRKGEKKDGRYQLKIYPWSGYIPQRRS